MMTTCNYNVYDHDGFLFFEESFDPKCFNVHFQLDEENDLSPAGWITFEPTKRTATMYYYGHPEDLSPLMMDYDLFDTVLGREVLIGFNEYKLGDLYRAAEQFTTEKVNGMAAR